METAPLPSASSKLRPTSSGGTVSLPSRFCVPTAALPATSVTKALGITNSSPMTEKPLVTVTVTSPPSGDQATVLTVP